MRNSYKEKDKSLLFVFNNLEPLLSSISSFVIVYDLPEVVKKMITLT